MLQIVASLSCTAIIAIDAPRVIIYIAVMFLAQAAVVTIVNYDCNMLIVQATVVYFFFVPNAAAK
jgi:hypothetical protein